MVDSSRNASPAPRHPPSDTSLPTAKLVIGVVSGLLVVAVVGFGMWWWVNTTSFNGDQKASAHLETVKVTASVVVMLGGLGALYLTVLRQRTQEAQLAHARDELHHARDTARATERDAEARRVTDLYAKAVEQLGSDKGPVRLGGLYALERLAQANPDQRQTVINVICAYLRMPYRVPDRDVLDRLEMQHENNSFDTQTGVFEAYPEDKELIKARERYELQQQEQEVRIAARRILASHLRPALDATGKPTNPSYWPGRLRIDLSGAVLVDADFAGCHFAEAVFDHTRFRGNARFVGANFRRTARFTKASFQDEGDFGATRFTRHAAFTDATFRGATNFGDASLSDADFAGGTFSGLASFQRTNFLTDAVFTSARFSATTFGQATFEHEVSFTSASFDDEATFDEVTFNGSADYSHVTFEGSTTFRNAANPQWVDLSSATAAVEANRNSTWPAGWHLDLAAATEQGDGLWAPLTPIEESVPD